MLSTELKDKNIENIEQLLDRIIKSEKLAHAYIFLGPQKDTMSDFALKFAKALNCLETNSSFSSCQECLSCKKIEHFNHPDIGHLRTEGLSRQIKIEQIRALIKDAYLKPIEAKKKVYIIYDADSMNEESANCLLKTLEEPPKDVIIVSVSTNLSSLLPTIISRCQIIKFPQGQHLDIADAQRLFIEEFLNAEDTFCSEGLGFIKRPKAEQLEAVDLLLIYFRNMIISKPQDYNVESILILMKGLLRAKELLQANVNSKLIADYILDNLFRLKAQQND